MADTKTSGNTSVDGMVDSVKGFFGRLFEGNSAGGVTGSILGVGGAVLVGMSFLGGGFGGWLVAALLALPLAMMGRQELGGWIDGLLGTGNQSAGQGNHGTTPVVAHEQARGMSEAQQVYNAGVNQGFVKTANYQPADVATVVPPPPPGYGTGQTPTLPGRNIQ